MKVYNLKSFIELPPGTIFCKGTKWCFHNLRIKGHSLDNDDFIYVDLCNIKSNDSGDWVDKLKDALENGTSYQLNTNAARDGLFDQAAVFLVYEPEDLKGLIRIFLTQL